MVAYWWTHTSYGISKFITPEIAFKTRGHCFFCGTGTFTKKDKATVDHLVPKCRGGDPDAVENLAVACLACNSDKGSMTVEEYREVIALNQMLFSMRVGLMPRVPRVVFYGDTF